MICPSCGFQNMQGDDNCANCGADLRTADVPQPGNVFEAQLVGEHLSDLGPRAPITVAATDTVADAIKRMQDENYGAVLVSDGSQLVGVFTERDAVMKVAGRPMDGLTVADVMTPDPVVLRKEDSVAVAIHKMASGGFRHIPVVEGGVATGIVSSRDIVSHLIELLG